MSLVSSFSSPKKCNGQVFLDEQGWIFTVKGKCSGKVVRYLAAAPSDLRQSRAGSGLPFPSATMAYENTPNKGEVSVLPDGSFQFELVYPSAYYINNGSEYVEPHVHFTVDDYERFDVKLGSSRFQDRSLKHLVGRARRTTGR